MAINPAKFTREVRQEMNRVHWPTRKETLMSTMVVLGLSILSALFFLLVDNVASACVQYILGMGE